MIEVHVCSAPLRSYKVKVLPAVLGVPVEKFAWRRNNTAYSMALGYGAGLASALGGRLVDCTGRVSEDDCALLVAAISAE